MSLFAPALLFELVIHVPASGREPTRYTTRFPLRLTDEERRYIAAHLIGQVLATCQEELGIVPRLVEP